MDLCQSSKPLKNYSPTNKPLDSKNNRTQTTVINLLSKDLLKVPQTRINTGFTKHFCLFELQFDGKQYKAKSTILSHFQTILDSLK